MLLDTGDVVLDFLRWLGSDQVSVDMSVAVPPKQTSSFPMPSAESPEDVDEDSTEQAPAMQKRLQDLANENPLLQLQLQQLRQ